MPKYNLIEWCDNYHKACGCLWQYYGDDNLADSKSFKSKIKIT